MYWSLFLIKKRLQHRRFPVNFWVTASFIEYLQAAPSVNLYPLEFRSVFSLFLSKVDHNVVYIRHIKWFELIELNYLLLPFKAQYGLQILIDVLNTMYIIIMLFELYSNKFYTVFNDTFTRSAARYWNTSKRF